MPIRHCHVQRITIISVVHFITAFELCRRLWTDLKGFRGLNPNLGVHELYVVLRTMPFNHYFGYGLITTWSARSVLHTTQ